MMAYVGSLEIGTLHCVKEDFCYELEGCYRFLAEFLPLLAKFYFTLAEMSEENLLWFNNEINKFHNALGVPHLGRTAVHVSGSLAFKS